MCVSKKPGGLSEDPGPFSYLCWVKYEGIEKNMEVIVFLRSIDPFLHSLLTRGKFGGSQGPMVTMTFVVLMLRTQAGISRIGKCMNRH